MISWKITVNRDDPESMRLAKIYLIAVGIFDGQLINFNIPARNQERLGGWGRQTSLDLVKAKCKSELQHKQHSQQLPQSRHDLTLHQELLKPN